MVRVGAQEGQRTWGLSQDSPFVFIDSSVAAQTTRISKTVRHCSLNGFNYLGVGFSILRYPIVLFLLSHSHDGPRKLRRTSCAYTQIREYAIDVLSVASWLIDNKIMLHYQFDETIAVIFIV